MISLLPHQKDVLALSKNRNRVSVKGYEGLYDIDTFGNIYTVKYNKPLKPYIKNGYLAVNLYKDKKCKHYYIHRLVASTFLNNDKNLFNYFAKTGDYPTLRLVLCKRVESTGKCKISKNA